MHTNVNGPGTRDTKGIFNYMSASTKPSLFRNGQVMIRRDPGGNTTHNEGFDLEAHTLSVLNARLMDLDTQPTCEKNGFELLLRPLNDEAVDFTDHEQVVQNYYGQCAAIVEQSTGARAYAFDHNVRSASGKKDNQRITGGQNVPSRQTCS